MFTYYLNSLHEFREKNLEFGEATTQAWLEIMAHLINGQYLIGRAVLHPAGSQTAHHPGAHWESAATNDHHELMMKWIDESVVKANKAQEIVFAAFAHNATGWHDFGHEIVRKLQRDAGPEYADALKLIDSTMREIASAESTALKSAVNVVKVTRAAKPVAKKLVVKKSPTKKTVKTVKTS